MDKLIKKAISCGFSEVSEIDPRTLEVREDVRETCAGNGTLKRCGQYGKNWACPPACGTLAECAARLGSYKTGILAITVGELEDSFDAEGIMETGKRHRENMIALSKMLAEEGADFLPLGAGSCNLCEKCAYPEPCRFPNARISSMEASGLLVGDVCKKNGAVYYHGPNKQAFFGCFLFR